MERIIREEGYTPNVVARQLSLSKQYQFSVIIPSLGLDAGYWRFPKEGIDAAVSTLSLQNVSVSYFGYDRYSRQSFREACEQVLQTESDGIILAPTQSEAADEFVSRISGKLPFVLIDAAVGDGSELSFIGQDAFQSGIVAGRLMELLTGESERFVIVEAGQEDKHLERRAEGFRSYFREQSATSSQAECITVPITGDTDVDENLEPVFAEGRPDGVFVTNAMAYAVAAWVNGNAGDGGTGGAGAHISLVGYDLVDENSRALREGGIDFVIHQRPRTQGYHAAHALYRHVVLGKHVEPRVEMPIDIVMRENLDYYEQHGAERAIDAVANPGVLAKEEEYDT